MDDIIVALRTKADTGDAGPYGGDLVRRAADEIERLRSALEPFAGDNLPSTKRTEIAYNRHGLRCLMSPREIAMENAYRALNHTNL